MGGPLFLQPDVGLVLADRSLALARATVPVSHKLTVGEAVALALLGQTGSADAALSVAAQCHPDGTAWVARVLDRYWTYLGEGPSRPLDEAWLRQVTAIQTPVATLPDSTVRVEAAPASVTWMVTLGCDRRCPYCFFDVFQHQADSPDSPPDATFPFEAAVRMVREMGQIGAADLFLTGGEPLLRRDLIEIIAEAKHARVRSHMVTKYAIDTRLARRLAEAGLDSITVSLDDGRAGAAAALTGARSYLAEARRAIAALLEQGLDLEVNAVITSKNADHLDGLVELLLEVGVSKLRLSPFSAPYPRRSVAERLVTGVTVKDAIATLSQRYGDRIELLAGSGSVAEDRSQRACGSGAVCQVGIRSLDVLPDGSVSRCHYLTSNSSMVVGSLVNGSLLDIWRGKALKRMARPDRAEYSGTSCTGCGSFEGCHSRGRCYVSSLSRSERLFAPDAFCTEPT
jgi:MoaA/NifB/PqqE/SkfB family radical SAM enzyme